MVYFPFNVVLKFSMIKNRLVMSPNCSAATTLLSLAWTMVHTTFTFHYARVYYSDSHHNSAEHKGGLCFPDEDCPDYLDFAYYAFVIGMTFQVSDVETRTRTFRRLTLLHSILSFGLNTFVVALTINLIASLKA